MSADNWAVCPKCNPNYDGPSGWEDATVDATFREDYEIYGAETGTLSLDYHGQCMVCDLGVHINEEKKFYERS